MEWVETTAKSLEEAQEMALDRLGVDRTDAEFEVLEEPRPGLFGRTRGQARLRARVKPTPVRAKTERRRRKPASGDQPAPASASTDAVVADPAGASGKGAEASPGRAKRSRSSPKPPNAPASQPTKETTMTTETTITPDEVATAAVTFMDGLVAAFGATGTSEVSIDGVEIDVRVNGEGLGLLVGPGGGTLNAVQDLVRVAAQRRLGDHETRLRIDVAQYRERRQAALTRFAGEVAAAVRDGGTARVLEPMSSADRKVVHDALADEPGVSSRSIGEDPNRKVIVEPANISVGDSAVDNVIADEVDPTSSDDGADR